jgi:ribonuclease P protein component
MPTAKSNALLKLRKHADYGRVYNSSKKQHARQMSFFFSVRPADRRSDTPGPRVGLTVGKVLGKAHERNRIKRRLRELVRRHALPLKFPVDVILHPRRTVMTLDHRTLDREVADIFRTIRRTLEKIQEVKTQP